MRFLFATVLCLSASIATADDNIVIVFDNSGSMADTMRGVNKTRMKVAQDSLITVMQQVPPTTKVGILTFTGWIYDIQPVDIAKITEAIRKVGPNCPTGTPLYQYIRDGADRLLKEREKSNNVGSYKMLVVTDGAANTNDLPLNNDSQFPDGSSRPGVLKDIIGRGITVDTIGLEIPGGHALQSQINGIYMSGDNPVALTNAIRKSVAEVGFAQSRDASDEAFKEVGELPDEFVKASLKGLTTFRNYAIGTQDQGDPGNGGAQMPAGINARPQPDEGIPTFMWVCGGVLALVVVAAFVIAANS